MKLLLRLCKKKKVKKDYCFFEIFLFYNIFVLISKKMKPLYDLYS